MAQAEVPLNDPEKSDGWSVTVGGRVNAYVNWIFGETINADGPTGTGNFIDPANPLGGRYRLVGPQVEIRGNPTPTEFNQNVDTDKDLNAFRIRGGFASTQIIFNLYKQLFDDLKLTLRAGMWAGIENGLDGGGVRSKNQAKLMDFREQYLILSGSWGSAWGGRQVGLYNRGGMRMNWWLMHQHGVGHPCSVDSAGTATCGHTGVGSMFPNRNAQIGYATPELAGLQLSAAIFDPSAIDSGWRRAPYPRLESEVTYKADLGDGDEINVWANGLTQVVGRTEQVEPLADENDPTGMTLITQGIAADATRNVWGVGGGAWGRLSGFAIGGTGWYGKGLGTATPLSHGPGGTAIDPIGELRTHFGYLVMANYRFGDVEIAAGYGSTNAEETEWDKHPLNPDKYSLIKEVRGISGKVAYHIHPSLVASIDGMNIRNTWWRGEEQVANTVSAGILAQW